MLRSIARSVARFQKRRSLLALLGIAVLASHASAVDITVTTDLDSGPGSLREAFTTAASGDRIVFDIAGPATITLLTDLPTVAGDISFANNNATPVTIDRNGTAALDFDGSLVDPTVLAFAATATTDILADVGTTIFGDGDVTGNLVVPGTIAAGADANPGTIGTFNVTGDLNLAGAAAQLDISATGTGTSNDLITVTGAVDVTGATLAPNFIGDQFEAGQTFLVLNGASPFTGAFANEADAFALPSNPFLQAVKDTLLFSDDFGFVIEDNGVPFTSVVTGTNQLSAAALLDQLQASATPPAALATLRNGTADAAVLAVDQLSGSIYPSLIGAEIIHIQNNLESVRDRVALQFMSRGGQSTFVPWVRAYGVSAQVEQDANQTRGYRHEIGGLELGLGMNAGGGLSAHGFAHLATANLHTRGVDQDADIDSYRGGGLIQYVGQNVYVIAAGGAGTQDYEVRRSLTAFDGSTFAASSFGGSSSFGYFEIGANTNAPLRPFTSLHTTRVEFDPVTETGDADFALINNGGVGDSLRGIIGLSLDKSNPTPIGVASLRTRFGWMHEYRGESETIVSQVANSGTPAGPLTDQGVDPGIDWAFVRMQLDMGILLGGQFSLAYEGQFNSDSSFNALLGGAYWVY